MTQVKTDQVKTPIQEITEFLDTYDIKYSVKDSRISIDKYHIQYVVAKDFPVDTPKHNIKGVPKDYFLKKSQEAEDKGEFICWVYDYEWNNPQKREVLKSYWLHSAGKTPNKWYGRDTEVRVVPSKEGIAFQKENCLFGSRGSSLKLGLYSKIEKNGFPAGTLLMIYTFGRNHFGGSSKDQIEVIRVGTKTQCQVVSGISKILKYFCRNYKTLQVGSKEYDASNLIFYVDAIHNRSDSMEALKFKYIKRTPGFMNLWLETGEVKHRQPNIHSLIMQKMKDGEILPIPTTGTKTYVLEITEEMRK